MRGGVKLRGLSQSAFSLGLVGRLLASSLGLVTFLTVSFRVKSFDLIAYANLLLLVVVFLSLKLFVMILVALFVRFVIIS
jgi:hypothetical protein